MFKTCKIEVLIIFDGGSLPAKGETDQERKEKRESAMEKGKELYKKGQKEEARKHFDQAVAITGVMVKKLMDRLREEKYEFIVSPYEADAQLAFFARNRLVDAVVTEDSDLIAYGCPRVITKLKHDNGHAKEIRYNDVRLLPEPRLAEFTDEMFQLMCVVAGCDYVKSVCGVGIKKAYEVVSKCRTVEKVVQQLKQDSKLRSKIPKNYEEKLREALMTFKHQRVFDITRNKLVHLNPLPQEILAELELQESQMKEAAEFGVSFSCRKLSFLGHHIEHVLAYKIASGEINPKTGVPWPEVERTSESDVRPSKKYRKSMPILEGQKTITQYLSSYSTPVSKQASKPFRTPSVKSDIKKKEIKMEEKKMEKKVFISNEKEEILVNGTPSSSPVRDKSRKSVFEDILPFYESNVSPEGMVTVQSSPSSDHTPGKSKEIVGDEAVKKMLDFFSPDSKIEEKEASQHKLTASPMEEDDTPHANIVVSPFFLSKTTKSEKKSLAELLNISQPNLCEEISPKNNVFGAAHFEAFLEASKYKSGNVSEGERITLRNKRSRDSEEGSEKSPLESSRPKTNFRVQRRLKKNEKLYKKAK